MYPKDSQSDNFWMKQENQLPANLESKHKQAHCQGETSRNKRIAKE